MTEASGGDIPARDHATRSFELRCDECGRWVTVALAPALAAGPVGPHGSGGPPAVPWPADVTCGACHSRHPLDLPGHVDEQGRLDGCPACGYHTLCIQKDVNSKLGVVVIVVVFAALIAFDVALPWLFAVLVPLALLDWFLLRRVVRRLLICYRCKALLRGFPPGPRCRPFDLATWEAHDPEEG